MLPRFGSFGRRIFVFDFFFLRRGHATGRGGGGGGCGFIRIHCTTTTCMQIFISSRNATSLWLVCWLFWSPHFWHLQFSSLLLQVKAVYHQVQSHRLNMCHHVDRCNPVFFSSGLLSCCILGLFWRPLDVAVFRGRPQMQIKGDRNTTVPKNVRNRLCGLCMKNPVMEPSAISRCRKGRTPRW